MSSITNRKLALVSLLLLLTACGNGGMTQDPTATPNVTIEILDGMHPEPRQIKVETIPQNNCGGTAEVENQVEKSRSIAHTIEVEGGFEVNANGGIGFADTDIELGAAVSAQLGYSYGTVEDISRSITVKAKPGTNMEHRVSLQEIWEVGTAKIVVGGIETTVPFSFCRDFAIELIDSKDIGCPWSTEWLPTPTRTLTPTKRNAVIELPELCGPISPCECTWSFKPIETSFPSPMKDTFSLQNTGTGNLELEPEVTSCKDCLAGWHNPANGDVISPGSHTQFLVEYYWDKDPLQGTDHEHTITVHSNAENCPELRIIVPIRYKNGFTPPTVTPTAELTPVPTAQNCATLSQDGMYDILWNSGCWKSDSYEFEGDTFEYQLGSDMTTITAAGDRGGRYLAGDLEVRTHPYLPCIYFDIVETEIALDDVVGAMYMQIQTGWSGGDISVGIGLNSNNPTVELIWTQGESTTVRAEQLTGGGFHSLRLEWQNHQVAVFVDNQRRFEDTPMPTEDYPGWLKLNAVYSGYGQMSARVKKLRIRCHE